jgi:thiamine-monophosphate kinase
MFENKETRTELSSLGEFGLINHLSEHIKIKNATTKKGIGDDAAVIEKNEKEFTLISSDMMVEGVHFDLSYVPLKHLGYKAVVTNISDICAMNGKAEQITVSIALSNRFSLEAVEELYAGMILACDKYGVDLVGGDTTSSTSGLIISISVLGTVKKDKIAYRSGANHHDLIVVSGDLGGAFMGLQVLEREKEVYKVNPNMQPDLTGHEYILQRQLKPEARKDIVEMLDAMGVIPTSMIDISDGLSSEILHLCKHSERGCDIYISKIPVDPGVISAAEEFNTEPVTVALNGGEDYELLFTIKQSDYDKIKGNPHLTVIGHMTEPQHIARLITQNNEAIKITAKGWNALEKMNEK